MWFTVEYESRGEWHLFGGPFPSMRQARGVKERAVGLSDKYIYRVVEHRVRD